MGFFKAAVKFVAKESAQSLCAELGRHIGDAIGNLAGKRIDPNHGKPPGSEGKEEKTEEAS